MKEQDLKQLSEIFEESINELKKVEDIFNKHIEERLRILKLSQKRTFQRFANKIMKLNLPKLKEDFANCESSEVKE